MTCRESEHFDSPDNNKNDRRLKRNSKCQEQASLTADSKPMECFAIGQSKAKIYNSFSSSDYACFEAAYSSLRNGERERLATAPRYFKVLTEECETSIEPFILVLYRANEPEGMIIGRVESLKLDMRIGRTSFLRPQRRCLVIPEGGVLVGKDSALVARRLLRALLRCFSFKAFEAISFHWLSLESAFYKSGIRKVSWPFRERPPIVDKHWYTELPPSFCDLLSKKSAKHRGNFRRALQKIENSHSPHFRMRTFDREDEVLELMRDAESVAVRSYQRAWGVGFIYSHQILGLLRSAAARDRLFALILYAEGTPVAFQIGVDHDGYHNIIYMAHDADFNDYGPGIYLLVKSLEEICRQKFSKIVDYGWGDGPHKRRFGTSYIWEGNPLFFAPTFDGFILSIGFTTIRIASECARKAARGLGIHERWKRYRIKNAYIRRR